MAWSVAFLALVVLAGSLSINADINVDVLQFALNLEYLEANFYHCAVYGSPINSTLRGGGPSPTGCTKALLSPAALVYAKAIAADEQDHVIFLRAALTAAGVTPVKQPALNIGTAFAVAANAAFGATLSPDFSPYGSDALFYLGSYIFEDVGATAYLGAAPLLSAAYLPYAGGILAVESYHGGIIRALLSSISTTYLYPYGVTVNAAVTAISALRDVAGKTNFDTGLVPLVPANVTNGILFSRTPSQVLSIVYLGGKDKGGFFPAGLNGNIKVVS